MLVGNLPYSGTPRTNIILRMTNSPTNQVSGGQANLASDPKPTTVADYMLFSTGSQNVRYSDQTTGTFADNWHVTPPYSIELDAMIIDYEARYLATSGDGFGAGWPEWNIVSSGGGFQFGSSSNNNNVTTTGVFLTKATLNQWYRFGLMFYNNGSDRVRGFVNDSQVFDMPCAVPYNSPNGLSFGGDAIKYPARQFKGRIRNVTIARSLFWPV
jgi:hypothetical protein